MVNKRIIKLCADTVFINLSFYGGYLLRFRGSIEDLAFVAYIKLWPHITLVHLIILTSLKAYRDPRKLSNKEIFKTIFNAVTVASLAAISIVYVMRNIYGFIPSSIFLFAWFFNLIILYSWRLLIKYET